ncbi:hypothetical protein BKA70DRAFT_1283279, partial [Coprinopsis sp. MPI-PUGE-AT-0042]
MGCAFPSLTFLGWIASNMAYLVGRFVPGTDLTVKFQLSGDVLNVAMSIMITFLIVLRVMRA